MLPEDDAVSMNLVICSNVNSSRRSAEVFYCCSSLEKVKLPNSVREITKFAFEKCDRLTFVGEKGFAAEFFSKRDGIPFEAED